MIVSHRSTEDLVAALDDVRRSPAERGTLELIVRRPDEDEREILTEATLDPERGLVGDRWSRRVGRADPERRASQLTLMNARFVSTIAGEPDRRALAGDQLYVDLDLSVDNLPAGSRLAVGEAVLEISPRLHKGCRKFSDRFGVEALRLVNTPEGRHLRLRGMYAWVVGGGVVRQGDAVRTLSS